MLTAVDQLVMVLHCFGRGAVARYSFQLARRVAKTSADQRDSCLLPTAQLEMPLVSVALNEQAVKQWNASNAKKAIHSERKQL